MHKLMSIDVVWDGTKMRAVPKLSESWRLLSDMPVRTVPAPWVHCSHVSDVEPFQLEAYLYQCVKVLSGAWEIARVTHRSDATGDLALFGND